MDVEEEVGFEDVEEEVDVVAGVTLVELEDFELDEELELVEVFTAVDEDELVV